MLSAKKNHATAPLLERRRRRWMSSEADFMRFGAMLLLPHTHAHAIGSGAGSGAAIGVEQLLKVCRKNGLKSKG